MHEGQQSVSKEERAAPRLLAKAFGPGETGQRRRRAASSCKAPKSPREHNPTKRTAVSSIGLDTRNGFVSNSSLTVPGSSRPRRIADTESATAALFSVACGAKGRPKNVVGRPVHEFLSCRYTKWRLGSPRRGRVDALASRTTRNSARRGSKATSTLPIPWSMRAIAQTERLRPNTQAARGASNRRERWIGACAYGSPRRVPNVSHSVTQSARQIQLVTRMFRILSR